MTARALPDLAVGLIRVRDAADRPREEGAGILPHVAELTAVVQNRGDILADETITRFWVSGADLDRELRAIHTPPVPPGDEIEVTALWDVRGRQGRYRVTAIADAFGQIDEVDKDNNTATVDVLVQDNRVELDQDAR